jgi:hypothetical protein
MGKRRWILWQGPIAPSMERFIITATDRGFELSGLILQAHKVVPYVVRDAIEVGPKMAHSTQRIPTERPWVPPATRQ